MNAIFSGTIFLESLIWTLYSRGRFLNDSSELHSPNQLQTLCKNNKFSSFQFAKKL